ncbi:baseplate J/gp47 family protein [Pantoea ananatis]|uniref:baseplate J/gp47 family protein n=1 Tax=Pantoea ananas TaxID=553 RepID=UPI001B31704E|nr:baseplate J/gp47 family protein [Pantoea ananatis]
MSGVIDISQLPVPQVVQVPDFETLLAERKAYYVSLFPASEQAAVARTLELESEPALKLLQEACYREVLLCQRINEAAVAGMVAFSTGADLDNLAANNNVKRLTITGADASAVPPVDAVMESDTDLRLRVPAAFEGLSVAGPTAAYESHARSVDGRVLDVSATSPAPATVVLTVLAREGDGTPPVDLLNAVNVALNGETVRPVADRLSVQAAVIKKYQVKARLHLFDNVAGAPCLAAASKAIASYITEQRKLGRSVRRDSYSAVLRVAGVDWVEIQEPAADMLFDRTQAGYCTAVSVELAGDEVSA